MLPPWLGALRRCRKHRLPLSTLHIPKRQRLPCPTSQQYRGGSCCRRRPRGRCRPCAKHLVQRCNCNVNAMHHAATGYGGQACCGLGPRAGSAARSGSSGPSRGGCVGRQAWPSRSPQVGCQVCECSHACIVEQGSAQRQPHQLHLTVCMSDWLIPAGCAACWTAPPAGAACSALRLWAARMQLRIDTTGWCRCE